MFRQQAILGVSLVFCFLEFGVPCLVPDVHLQIYFLQETSANFIAEQTVLVSEFPLAMKGIVRRYGTETEFGFGTYCNKEDPANIHCYNNDVPLARDNQDLVVSAIETASQHCDDLDDGYSSFDGMLQASHDVPWSSGTHDPITGVLNIRILCLFTYGRARFDNDERGGRDMSSLPPAEPGVDCVGTKYPTDVTVIDALVEKDLLVGYFVHGNDSFWWTEFYSKAGALKRGHIFYQPGWATRYSVCIQDIVDMLVCLAVERPPVPTVTITTKPTTTTTKPTTTTTTTSASMTHKKSVCKK